MPGNLGGFIVVKLEKTVMVLIVVSILVAATFTLGCTSTVKQYNIATGGTSGTYYPIGIGIAQAAAANSSIGYNITVEATGASVYNCRLLSNNTADFALIQNDVAYAAVNGQRDFTSGNLTMIKGVASLYPETIQVFTLNSSGIKSIYDLKGKRVSLGDKGSGSWFDAIDILKAYNLTENDVQNVGAVKVAQAGEMMKNNQLDAAFWTGGAPTGAITELATTSDIYLVPISGAERSALIASSPFFQNQTLPANVYRGITGETETVTVMAILVVRQDIPEQDVYSLLKAMYDGSQPINKYPHAVAPNIIKQNGLVGMPIPLHSGAQKYFTEQGIKAP